MLHIRLHLQTLASLTTSFSALTLNQIDEKIHFASSLEDTKRIVIDWHNSQVRVRLYDFDIGGTLLGTYEGSDIPNISSEALIGDVDFYCNISNGITTFRNFITNNIIELNVNGYTALELYRLNDKRNKLNKTLGFINIIEGQFKTPVSIKSFSIDVIDYPLSSTYNYVYISKLKRYYYVNDIAFISKDLTRINLVEDVLMSWRTLISSQSVFISRYSEATNRKIVDPRYPLESTLTISYTVPTPTTTPLTNITLKGNFDVSDYNYLVSVNTDSLITKENVSAPTGSSLPDISPVQSKLSDVYFVTYTRLTNLMNAFINDDTMASYVNSILFLPFVPDTVFDITKTNPLRMGLPTPKVLCDDDNFHPLNNIPAGVTIFSDIGLTKKGTSPYLILADFTFSSSLGNKSVWYDCEPYANYEIYVAFVGWVQVSLSSVSGKRLLIYYVINFQTGNATAYIYNKTDEKVIWSGSCQLGVKLDILSSNALELSRERQATELNTLIGLVASGLSIGAGVVSENPVAVAGGLLSAGKTIASAVNSERMRFERGQVTYGSGESGLHSQLTTVIRKTYNKPVINTSLAEGVYKMLQGYPYNNYVTIYTLTAGSYIEVGDIQFNASNNDIYNVEIDEIVALLKSGVIM